MGDAADDLRDREETMGDDYMLHMNNKCDSEDCVFCNLDGMKDEVSKEDIAFAKQAATYGCLKVRYPIGEKNETKRKA